MTSTFRLGIVVFACIAVVAAALAYVLAPPKGLDGYRERAAATAETLGSQVETALLWSRTYRAGKATPAATLVGFEEAEEDADAAAAEFEGYEPADGGTAYRRELTLLASEVADALSQLRIAAQQERWGELGDLSAPLPGISTKLSRFEERAEP